MNYRVLQLQRTSKKSETKRVIQTHYYCGEHKRGAICGFECMLYYFVENLASNGCLARDREIGVKPAKD